MKLLLNPIALIGFICFFACSSDQSLNAKLEPGKVFAPASINAPLKPYDKNPFYWEYNGNPVILLGGSKDDNLFQIANMETHLKTVRAAGGNYVRNTMSSRDEGNERAFKKLSDGRYDLDQWNPTYWQKFDTFLSHTKKLGIFVQIELWDQWDHIQKPWDADPWNPEMNINYDSTTTILDGTGSYENINHYSGEPHPFFLSVPNLQNDELVLHYQKKFINKVMSYTLRHDHILYTITNELFNQHPIAWSYFWIDYINKKAQEVNKQIQVTEMFQESDINVGNHKVLIKHPEIFDYLDLSQNSSQIDQAHWDQLQRARKSIMDNPRPINHTKTYGAEEVSWTDGSKHGIERFWRNIIGGAGSVRFHRPPSGLGLSPIAQIQLKSARLFLSEFDIFNAEPDAASSLLAERNANEAYLTAIPGKQYAIYFPAQGTIALDLSSAEGEFEIKWLHIDSSNWYSISSVQSAQWIELQTPAAGSWIALLSKK